jgi:hypothetical protein
LLPGDALNKPGFHVMLFLRFTPDKKVEANIYPLASLLARGYDPGPLSGACQRHICPFGGVDGSKNNCPRSPAGVNPLTAGHVLTRVGDRWQPGSLTRRANGRRNCHGDGQPQGGPPSVLAPPCRHHLGLLFGALEAFHRSRMHPILCPSSKTVATYGRPNVRRATDLIFDGRARNRRFRERVGYSQTG